MITLPSSGGCVSGGTPNYKKVFTIHGLIMWSAWTVISLL